MSPALCQSAWWRFQLEFRLLRRNAARLKTKRERLTCTLPECFVQVDEGGVPRVHVARVLEDTAAITVAWRLATVAPVMLANYS